MSEVSKWASFVRAHRLAQCQNQGEFAKALGVSQQTVSRWESGGQIPDPSIQQRLKEQFRATALGSTAYWKYRVGSSNGHEILVDRELNVLAASRKATRVFRPDGGSIDGLEFPDLIPETELTQAAPMGLNSIRHFREIGFFDALIRSVRLDMEWRMEHASCACQTDVWPVLTSEQTILGHFTGSPVPIPVDPNGFRGVRVNKVEVRVNKDMTDE